MITKLIQYTLRTVNVLIAVLIGALFATPAVASHLHAMKKVEERSRSEQSAETDLGGLADASLSSAINSRGGAGEPPTVASNAMLSALAQEREQDAIRAENDPTQVYLSKKQLTAAMAQSHSVKTHTTSVPIPGHSPTTTASATPTSTPTSEPTHSTPPPTVKPSPKPVPSPVHTATGAVKRAAVVAFARAQLGEPYVFAGAGPNVWDCSGLTLMAYAAVGVHIGTHSATNQYNTAADRGDLVPYANRSVGDLIFYTDGGGDMYHVTIYSGNGHMIEAPREGVPVREVPVRDTDRVSQVAHFID